MPTCRRKRVLLTEPPQALLDAGDKEANRQVYYLAQTGEIFQSFEGYAARMSFYRMRQFQCEVTGKSNLTYFEALESELQEARTMHSRFPEPLKASILRAVQWQVMGRLDHLVDAVYERFKDRYFPEERVLVDIQGDKYFARVAQAFPPRVDTALGAPTSTDQRMPLHVIGGDFKISTKDAMEKDDPIRYLYQIQIIDEERSSDNKLSVKDREIRETNRAKWSASLMEVTCTALSRDRLAFSKSILRRFIRDCVDRDAALASPWTVKQAIAERYGVPTVMPDDTKKGVETIKKGEIEKRKKVWEDKEGPPSKKQKKADARAEALALAAEIRARDGDKAKAEAEAAAEKKKKKPIRYPTEDLDVRLTDKEIKAGAQLLRPVPSRSALPFGRYFETFLMTWNFLVTYGHTLHLSTFTLDDFEHALRHSVADPSCSLLAEIHSSLIYNLRTVPFIRHSAVLSLLHQKDNQKVPVDSDDEDSNDGLDASADDLAAAMADIGNSWERVPLRHVEGREGWQDALVGCLKDHADLDKFPRLRQVLTRLVFASQEEAEETASSTESSHSRHTPVVLNVPSTPAKRYHTLPPEDKIDILSFLCNVAVSSKAIHTHMETSEEQLTALRKEKIEVNRTRKQYKEDIAAIVGEKPEGEKGDSSDLSDAPSESENGENGTGKGRRRAAGETAKQRQAARAKLASAKQAQAEQRRLEEELAKLDRRMEGIEREFRKLLGCVRARPLGKDRFHNRVWWFDGLGAASLIGSGGSVLYGTGRLFIQGPSVFDVDLLKKRQDEEKDVERRRDEEEGPEGQLGIGEWAVYEDLDDVNEFLAWLNSKGVRELALKNTITKWWNHIGPGIRKRAADLGLQAKIPDARRSSRVKVGPNSDLAREPYMLWTNRRAVNTA